MGIGDISSFKGQFSKIFGFLEATFLFASVNLYIKVRMIFVFIMAGCHYREDWWFGV